MVFLFRFVSPLLTVLTVLAVLMVLTRTEAIPLSEYGQSETAGKGHFWPILMSKQFLLSSNTLDILQLSKRLVLKPDAKISIFRQSQSLQKFPATHSTTIKLDELFDRLKREHDNAKAGKIAKKIWREWNISGSDSINLLMSRTERLINIRKFSLALDILDQIVRHTPNYAEVWNRRAIVYLMLGDYGRSIASIQKTLELEPRHFGALSGLATILQQIKNPKKALKIWYHVLKIYPAMEKAQKAVIKLEEEISGSRA